MHATNLICPNCGWEATLGNIYSCEKCQYSLDVAYDYGNISKADFTASLDSRKGVWDFKFMLPVKNDDNIVTLHEGNTPLIESSQIGRRMGLELYFKDESRNPTCSFKDRPNTVGISVAKEQGLDAVTIASTGNAGSSLAAFAAKAKMKCYIFIPQNTPVEKVSQAAIHGAAIIKVKGNYSDSYAIANMAAKRYNWANLTSTYLNPYTVEGDKTIAYELYTQLKGKIPDWIVVPLGAGALLSGIYKGFAELRAFGLIEGPLPRMIGVQAEGCSPITGAFENGLETVEAFKNPKTIAGGICDPLTGYSQDGTRTLRAIRKSGGVGVSVSDESIKTCLHELARLEAIFCEPASAASLSAVYALSKNGVIQQGERIVAMITAHGLKDAGEIGADLNGNVKSVSNINEFEALLQK